MITPGKQRATRQRTVIDNDSPSTSIATHALP